MGGPGEGEAWVAKGRERKRLEGKEEDHGQGAKAVLRNGLMSIILPDQSSDLQKSQPRPQYRSLKSKTAVHRK